MNKKKSIMLVALIGVIALLVVFNHIPPKADVVLNKRNAEKVVSSMRSSYSSLSETTMKPSDGVIYENPFKPSKYYTVVSGAFYARYIEGLIKTANLELTKEQVAKVQDAYNTAVRSRLLIEGDLAEVYSISKSESNIVIPAYTNSGVEIKANLNSAIFAALGDDLGKRFIDAFQGRITTAMNGYGENPQEIYVREEDDGFYRIEHKVIVNYDAAALVSTSISRLNKNDLSSYATFASLFPHKDNN